MLRSSMEHEIQRVDTGHTILWSQKLNPQTLVQDVH